MKSVTPFVIIAVGLLLAGCQHDVAGSAGSGKVREEPAPLTKEEREFVLEFDQMPLKTVIEAITGLSIRRAEGGRSIDNTELSRLLDQVFKISCGKVCNIEEKEI